MGSDWPNVQLGDYCLKIGSGATPKGGSSVYLEVGEVSLIRSQNIHNDDFKSDGLVYISPIAAAKLSNVTVELRDILLNITGDSVARVCMAPEEYLPARVNQHVAIIRPNPDEFDARFLRYFLTAPYSQATLLTLASAGATRNALTKSMIEGLVVPKPPLGIQKAIADKLSLLDSKIKLNQQTNQTLEKMARALFQSWFVDFDPVIDNALAAGKAIPDELQERAELRKTVIAQRATNPKLKPLPDNIQQLFPSEFEDSELGWIPKGWEITSFESLISIIGGGTPKTTIDEYWGGTIPWFSVVDAPNDSDVFVIDTEKHITQLGVDKSSTKLLRKGSTIISARGTVGKCALVGTPMAMNQSCYGIVGNYDSHDEYIYFLTRYQVSDLQKRGHGSVFNTITKETFKSIKLAKSSDLLTQKFSETVNPYLSKILSNNKQNNELTKIRDLLLPKLISGEIQLDSKEQELMDA